MWNLIHFYFFNMWNSSQNFFLFWYVKIGGRSVGIVRLRTNRHGVMWKLIRNFFLFWYKFFLFWYAKLYSKLLLVLVYEIESKFLFFWYAKLESKFLLVLVCETRVKILSITFSNTLYAFQKLDDYQWTQRSTEYPKEWGYFIPVG
jgi:hypothetical protein